MTWQLFYTPKQQHLSNKWVCNYMRVSILFFNCIFSFLLLIVQTFFGWCCFNFYMPLIWWESEEVTGVHGEKGAGWLIQMHNISTTRQHFRACVEPTRPRFPLFWGNLVRKRQPRTLKYGNVTDRIDHRSGLCVLVRPGKCDVASAILLASAE